MFMNLQDGLHVKQPGSINGQQFIIDSCKDCDLYVLDHTAQVTIDDCTNCRIFIGPTDASIFIRDCQDCKCAFICRQFRTRDIQNVDISLHCATRPVIETSKNLRFGCYDFNYSGLGEHLAACSISVYANHYSYIHDFNPDPTNWTFLPEGSTADLLEMPEEVRNFESSEVHSGGHSLVRSLGERPVDSDIIFALFPPNSVNKIPAILQEIIKDSFIVRMNCAKLDAYIAKDLVESIFDKADSNSTNLLSEFKSEKSVYIEFTEGATSESVMEAITSCGGYIISEDWASELRYAGIDG